VPSNVTLPPLTLLLATFLFSGRERPSPQLHHSHPRSSIFTRKLLRGRERERGERERERERERKRERNKKER